MTRGHLGTPFYKAASIISECFITKQPKSVIPESLLFVSSPFSVQVSNQQKSPFRYIIASVHIVVKQNGVVLSGASSVVNPYTGTASLNKFKLVDGGGLESITYDVVSNGVVCLPASDSLLEQASSYVQGNFIGNSRRIKSVPSTILPFPSVISVFAGVQPASVPFLVLDANGAWLLGVTVRIQVRPVITSAAVCSVAPSRHLSPSPPSQYSDSSSSF